MNINEKQWVDFHAADGEQSVATPDKRLNWEYKRCKIVPVACYRDSNWGKEAEPIDFGSGPRSRYWRIDFPDGTWVHVATISECRDYIDKHVEKHQVCS